MPVGRKKRLAITQRRQRVAELSLKGWTQPAIAAELGVSQSTVSTDLKAIEQDWRDSTLRDFDLARAVELQKLDCLERELWDEWRRSREPVESTRLIQIGSERRAEKRVTEQRGDRHYLELILRLGVERRKLLGLDRIASTSPDGQQSDQPIKVAWDDLFGETEPIPDLIEERIQAERDSLA